LVPRALMAYKEVGCSERTFMDSSIPRLLMGPQWSQSYTSTTAFGGRRGSAARSAHLRRLRTNA